MPKYPIDQPPRGRLSKKEILRAAASRSVGWFGRGRVWVLARRLLRLDPADRLGAVESDPRLRSQRLSLAQQLVRAAESTLDQEPRQSEEAADLALAIAGGLDGDEHDEARRTCAMASWLLGKARLRSLSAAGPGSGERGSGSKLAAADAPAEILGPRLKAAKRFAAKTGADWGRLTNAAVAFAQVTAFASAQPSWERALSAVGLAQVQWLLGRHPSASALYAAAALRFSQVGADEPVAACQVQHGFLLLGTGDRMLARIELAKADRRLDARRAPTLALLTAIGLASCAATAGRAGDAAAHLAKAGALWRVMPAEHPAIPAPWREMLGWEADHEAAELGDRTSLALFAGSPWRGLYPEALVALADRLLLGRAENEPAGDAPAARK
jgi:hypothetical protein